MCELLSITYVLYITYSVKNKMEDIKADMKKKCLKNKEYINSIGKWNEYLKYLEKEIEGITK